MRRRRSRCGAYADLRDQREVVIVEGWEVPCEQFKSCASMPVMAAVDAMPAEWRALIYEYGAEAHELFDSSVPMFANQKRMSAGEAARILESRREQTASMQ